MARQTSSAVPRGNVHRSRAFAPSAKHDEAAVRCRDASTRIARYASSVIARRPIVEPELQCGTLMSTAWILALAGGALIGVASGLLLVSHGRIAGISGIVGSLLSRSEQHGWRLAFVGGLAAVGVVTSIVAPTAIGASSRGLPFVIAAGLLVGFGTRLGGGCTSGHGVCGVARLSWRSIVAVMTFVAAGAVTTLVVGGAS